MPKKYFFRSTRIVKNIFFDPHPLVKKYFFNSRGYDCGMIKIFMDLDYFNLLIDLLHHQCHQ